jgi:uncharacterized protein (TIGR03066 family)
MKSRADRSRAVAPDGRREEAAAKASAPRGGWLPKWAVAVLCVAHSAAATFAVFEYVILSKVPRAMLGKWVVTEGEMEGATVQFFRDGTMICEMNRNGKPWALKAQVRAEGDTLWSTATNSMTGKADTDMQTIVSLTDTQLVLEDKTGTLLKMERAP